MAFWVALIVLLLAVLPVPNQAQVAGDYAVQAEVSNQYPYVGQSLTYTVRYYAHNLDRILPIEPVIFPEFEGFWIGDVYEREPQTVTLENRQYYMGEIVFEIVPLLAGTISIAPSQLILLETAYAPTTSYPSNDILLEVLALPENASDNFMGAVGQYRINFELEKTNLHVGESVTLMASITAQSGTLNHLNPPLIELGDEWHLSQGISRSAEMNIIPRRVFEWVLIPLRSGLLSVDGLKFSYFDPLQAQYITFEQPPIAVNVTGSTDLTFQPATGDQVSLKAVGAHDRLVYPPAMLWFIPVCVVGLIGMFRLYHPYQLRRSVAKRQREALGQALRRIDDLSNHPHQQLNQRTVSIIKLYLKDKGYDGDYDERLSTQIHRINLYAEEIAYKPTITPTEQMEFIAQFKAILIRIDAGWEQV